MKTQTLVILPKLDTYRSLGSNESYFMKTDIIEKIKDVAGGTDKATFVLQDELALQFFGRDCNNWISCLSSMDDTILNRISPMPEVYYDRLKDAEKLDRKLFAQIAKDIRYPNKDKGHDNTHLNMLSLQTLRQRVGKALDSVYPTFDLILYISKGNSFMRAPKIEMGRESLIALYDLKETSIKYYYSGVEVEEDIFNQIKGGLIL